jgi:hypothetical protein
MVTCVLVDRLQKKCWKGRTRVGYVVGMSLSALDSGLIGDVWAGVIETAAGGGEGEKGRRGLLSAYE